MVGWIIAGVLVFVNAHMVAGSYARHRYMGELKRSKVGSTIARLSKASVEIFTFASTQLALEHPQEITFVPDLDYPSTFFANRETVFLLGCQKQPIEVFDGKNFRMISDSELLTITDDDGNKSYVYLTLKTK